MKTTQSALHILLRTPLLPVQHCEDRSNTTWPTSSRCLEKGRVMMKTTQFASRMIYLADPDTSFVIVYISSLRRRQRHYFQSMSRRELGVDEDKMICHIHILRPLITACISLLQRGSSPTSSRRLADNRKLMKISQLVSWCFEPIQPQRIIPGLKKTFIKR